MSERTMSVIDYDIWFSGFIVDEPYTSEAVL